MKSKNWAEIDPDTFNQGQLVSFENDKVTCLQYQHPNRMIVGSKEGRITFYDLQKKAVTLSFYISAFIMKQIVKIIELPAKVECKKHLYYTLTHGNLYVLTKSDHSIQK